MKDNNISLNHLENIKNISKKLNDVTLMEVCGGHTNLLLKYGIRDILPKNIHLISGPGCPVCVTSRHDVDCMLELAKNNIPIATYGDMMRVPGTKYSLEDIHAKGGKIFEIYSTTEVIKLKKKYPNIVFFGIGFETTTPMSAFLLKNNVCVYSVHKLIPPALELLINDDAKLDGFIDPGHVSTIIGVKPYEQIKIAQAIAGFTPEEILRAINVLLQLISRGEKTVINAYPEAVNYDGNIKAQNLMKEYFEVKESRWRGLGLIPNSGLEVKNDKLNAKKIYSSLLKNVPPPKPTKCKCGEVLKGLIEPVKCPLYRKICSPKNPHGACMVSTEGSCSISYNYGL